ncbi:hypothetical protein [Streptomyces chryseus]|uniref:hypothetical protein n=1 Tax=Streptomyces chryseus TaxID=68186 RepID=UPI00110F9584|nr:hypothetical protein [Streptomyces chryseus]GGW99750.1 hypothetical protein GCM10010353_14290 [Streptomyces chryseus]
MAQTVPAQRTAALVPPPVEAVMGYAAEQTVRAARTLWPRAAVVAGEVAPSVTSYVQRIEVDGRPLYGKLPLLGVSLVSVLRGVCGDWAAVEAAQVAYAKSPASLARREAYQLRTLAAAGLLVPKVAGCADGVLFTEPVPGPTLGELISREPHRTAGLLGRVADVLDKGLSQPGLAGRVDRATIGERSISTTFQRKFTASSGAYLQGTGYGELLAPVVERLRAVPLREAPFQPVIFGDLKPEHVVFPAGADGPVMFLDPGLQRGRPCADAAKVASRTVLSLIACPPSSGEARAVLSGLAAFAAGRTAGMDPADQDTWLREFVSLWLMDTVNILTTYLSAPPGLSLSDQAAAVAHRALVVCQMLDHATASMASRAPARSWWRVCLDDAVWAVSA